MQFCDERTWHTVTGSIATYAGGKEFGLRIQMLTAPHEDDQKICRNALDHISELMQTAVNLRDHEDIEKWKLEQAELVRCFTEADSGVVFVEKIPNGYCSRACCVNKHWLIVTTRIGRIKIGWRKSVINIDWSDSINKRSATAIFPLEDVTKGDYSIHAWGYEKATEYLKKIIGF